MDPCLIYKKVFFLDDLFWSCFDHSSLNQMQTYHHVLSITHFHSCFFLTFPFKNLFIQKKLSIKDYLLLIYTFMCMIIQDTNSKFPKSQNPHSQCRFGNGVESLRTVLYSLVEENFILLVNIPNNNSRQTFCYFSCDLFCPQIDLSRN